MKVDGGGGAVVVIVVFGKERKQEKINKKGRGEGERKKESSIHW